MTTPPKRWDGAETAVIASETDPWLEDALGREIDLSALLNSPAFPSQVHGCETCDGGLMPGVFAPVNDAYGVEACDTCQHYPGDLDAARALAERIGPGVTVWYTPHRSEAA